jgi:LDH2 family malate/lactate/ureidoglycolate dehydrogenase
LNPKGNCLFVQLIDSKALWDGDEFAPEVSRLVQYVRSCPARDEEAEMTLAGDRSGREFEARERSGVPIDDVSWDELVRLVERLKIEAPHNPWATLLLNSIHRDLQTSSVSWSAMQ